MLYPKIDHGRDALLLRGVGGPKGMGVGSRISNEDIGTRIVSNRWHIMT